MGKIDDLRERLMLQMYDTLVFLAEVAGDDEEGCRTVCQMLRTSHMRVDQLHTWWAKEGQSLAGELSRIRNRLEIERVVEET